LSALKILAIRNSATKTVTIKMLEYHQVGLVAPDSRKIKISAIEAINA